MIRAMSQGAPFQTTFENSTHHAVADAPIAKGGGGQGFGPHELLEAALATCITMTVRMYAIKHGIPVEASACGVTLDRTDPDAAVLNYHLTFEGAVSEEQAERLRKAASDCPVGRILSGNLTLKPISAEPPVGEAEK